MKTKTIISICFRFKLMTVAIIWLYALIGSCFQIITAAKNGSKNEASHRRQEDRGSLLDGRIIPKNATKLHAPTNIYRTTTTSKVRTWVKIMQLKSEGEKVKQNDVLARFEFKGQDEEKSANKRIEEADANANKSELDLKIELQALIVERDKKMIEAKRAHLDTLKAKAISKRQLELYKINSQIAAFEAQAVKRQIRALRRKIHAESRYHKKQKDLARADLKRFHYYQGRFNMRAPHDGVLTYAYDPDYKRRIKKGDGLMSGQEVVSIAKDKNLAVNFYVPEKKLHKIKLGMTVRVMAVATDDVYPAVVRRIEMFPQEMGFLRGDDKLPNAREKAFVVKANFNNRPSKLMAGNEIKVRLQ